MNKNVFLGRDASINEYFMHLITSDMALHRSTDGKMRRIVVVRSEDDTELFGTGGPLGARAASR